MYHNIKVLFWSMEGYDEYDCDGLEWNVFKPDNMLWNMLGVDKLYWDEKELNVLKYEGFNIELDGI